MKYKTYRKKVKSIVVQQLTSGGWVELIRIPLNTTTDSTPEDIQEVIEEVHKLIFKSEKVELSIQGVQVCITGIGASQGTFRVIASPYSSSTLFIEDE